MRDGKLRQIPTEEIVVGDVFVLEAGRSVAADGFVVDVEASTELLVDESTRTGEAESCRKLPSADCYCFCNTFVVSGQGKLLVTEVGKHSTWGHTIVEMQAVVEERTPLQKDMWHLVFQLGVLGFVASCIVFFVLATFWAVDTASAILVTAWQASYINGLINALVVALTLLVVAIPEGLPLVRNITISPPDKHTHTLSPLFLSRSLALQAFMICLAYSSARLAHEQCLVRQMAACEMVGATRHICTDSKNGCCTKESSAQSINPLLSDSTV